LRHTVYILGCMLGIAADTSSRATVDERPTADVKEVDRQWKELSCRSAEACNDRSGRRKTRRNHQHYAR